MEWRHRGFDLMHRHPASRNASSSWFMASAMSQITWRLSYTSACGCPEQAMNCEQQVPQLHRACRVRAPARSATLSGSPAGDGSILSTTCGPAPAGGRISLSSRARRILQPRSVGSLSAGIGPPGAKPRPPGTDVVVPTRGRPSPRRLLQLPWVRMSRPARSLIADVLTAIASWNFRGKRDNPHAGVERLLPHMLTSNQRGRGKDGGLCWGGMRSAVAVKRGQTCNGCCGYHPIEMLDWTNALAPARRRLAGRGLSDGASSWPCQELPGMPIPATAPAEVFLPRFRPPCGPCG